jgi:hypothetical protein
MASDLCCIICGGFWKLAVLGRKGLEAILKSSKSRGDKLVSEFSLQRRHGIHEKCRRNYTNMKNIEIPQHGAGSENGVAHSVDTQGIVFSPVDAGQNASVHSGIPTLKSFSWLDDCFVCGKPLKMKDKKGRLMKISRVKERRTSKEQSLQETVLFACSRRTDELAAAVMSRIELGTDLAAVGAGYHAGCIQSFVSQRKFFAHISQTTAMQDGGSESVDLLTPDKSSVSISCFTSEDLVVNSCGPATSHHQYLLNVATRNGLQLVETEGGGNFF